jgi:hypothetical protein
LTLIFLDDSENKLFFRLSSDALIVFALPYVFLFLLKIINETTEASSFCSVYAVSGEGGGHIRFADEERLRDTCRILFPHFIRPPPCSIWS